LLDDVPGVGKTTLALAICKALGLTFHRVQFTPDVLPSDLTGFSMMDKSSGDFVYHPGTLSKVNLLLADEINRGASKTQSALLEAMEEKQVSVDGETHPLERPFLVIATQNSIGTAGTHLLPYAQMDRFLVQLSLGYPDYEAQMEMLRARQDGQPLDHVSRVISKDEFLQMQREVQSVTAKEPILDYITRLTIASRTCEDLEIGISPRGALFLDRMAKARAYMEGRDYVTGTDVQEVFPDVCSHRVILKGSGKTAREVLGELLRGAPSPDHRVLNGLRKSIRP
ncbi:MAG: MoxR family ATPase, partial [Clostridia bacterium]|nr:MoxR family ATPase [Clostridia bacterium]